MYRRERYESRQVSRREFLKYCWYLILTSLAAGGAGILVGWLARLNQLSGETGTKKDEKGEEKVDSNSLIWTGGNFEWTGAPYPDGSTHVFSEQQWPRVGRWAKKVKRHAKQTSVRGQSVADIVDDYQRRILALIWIESVGDEFAYYEKSGATGLGGVICGEFMAGRPVKQELFNPDTNLVWTCQILGDRVLKHGQSAGYDSYSGGYIGYGKLVQELAKNMIRED